MFAFPGMLSVAAYQAGIKVPLDCEDFEPEEFVHFAVFCNAQLGRPMPYSGCHFDNAKVIAALSEEECKSITFAQLVEKGFVVGQS
jgi:hypothetical protein